jgi:hypothetical protein
MNGSFSDGSGSSDYQNDADCEWVIMPTGASYIKIMFTEFNTQRTSDKLSLSYCQSSDCLSAGYELATLSGTYATLPTVISKYSFVRLKFTSDASITAPGFSAVWDSYKVI